MRMSQRKLILYLVFLFPITTVTERYIGFVNKILLGLVTVLLLVRAIHASCIKSTRLVWMIYALACYVVSLCLSSVSAIQINLNMAIYYPFLVLYYFFIIDNKESLWRDIVSIKRYIHHIVFFYTTIILVSAVSSRGYMTMSSGGWGTERYFASFSNSPNRVGPASMFIVAMIIFLYINGLNKKISLLLMVPQLFTAFTGGSRTYFVLIVAEFLVFYYWVNSRKNFLLSLIPVAAIGVYFFLRSSTMNKVMISLSYLNTGDSYQFWRRLTNSRNLIWKERIDLFYSFGIINKIFGKGINYSSYIFGLWSHNDFIEMLLSCGIVGTVNYIFIIILLFKSIFRKKFGNGRRLLCVFLWLFNAFMNFYYCYFNAVLSLPFLMLTITSSEMQTKIKQSRLTRTHKREKYSIESAEEKS